MAERTAGNMRAWFRAQPDRPLVILTGHVIVMVLYASGHAVSAVPFSSHTTRNLISSPITPLLHCVAAVLMLWGIAFARGRGLAAGLSAFTWAATTAALFFAATQRKPPLALWAPGLSIVITIAAVLMVVRWGVEDVSEGE